MVDSILYQENVFIVLEANELEQIFTPQELLEKLKKILLIRQDDLPRELKKLTSIDEQAEYLKNNFCELEMEPDNYLQWYAIRLEK
ncbi:MAG: chlororespiratory reduction protein 7 [cyanobacterium endosymbiont of Rhopalodia musculus]|uniref:chlororespiratory reduction protein 7 n=1 Tax=cyanobacterium endosymbiont of Epithemia clementina EcSB TaxID=3034674 RepID=UPI002480F7D8|nr:chlororespiratory reduction protein 7 [cyanobacterium endosymbiont of Epithemia clementina EcSB]WGT67669.1 chlororespiratory reduction protein 7 [cyanobacterium endosymbiont of Epithemia clementina EcSB]